MPDTAITLSNATIHNPSEPRHFMRLKPVGRRIRVYHDETLLAETTQALRLLEVGRDFYDPILYVPAADLRAALLANDKTTHCPLKGDTVYFDLLAPDGAVVQKNIAWSYKDTLDIAEALHGRYAFDPALVTIVESPN